MKTMTTQASKRIVIEPLTRVEGHGKVSILLDDDNRVARARLDQTRVSDDDRQALRPRERDVEPVRVEQELAAAQANIGYAHLRGRGVEVSDPKLGSDQSWQAWITDPDGNRIELHDYTAESWQAPHLA